MGRHSALADRKGLLLYCFVKTTTGRFSDILQQVVQQKTRLQDPWETLKKQQQVRAADIDGYFWEG